MPESLGARLRRRREEQRIALSTIAERTKIKSSLLDALERDDVSQWPAGIYRRAFIRSYAHAIGLDPDPVVREFLELYPDPDEAAADAPAPPSGFRGVVGLALGSLARLGRGSPAEPPPPRAETLNLHEPATPPLEPATPPLEPAPTFESQPEPGFDATDYAEPSLEPMVDAFAQAFEAAASDMAPFDEPAMAEAHPVPAIPQAPEPSRSSAAIFEVDLSAVARVCTGFAQVETGDDVPPLLAEASKVLGALGIIAWIWDPIVEGLRPVLAHGYAAKLLAQFPTVRQDDDNATAAAYRTGAACAIRGSAQANGAFVVPLLTAAGPSGVLAIELPGGREDQEQVRAAATIFASMLAPLVCAAPAVPADPLPEPAPQPGTFTPPVLRTTTVRR